MSRIFQPGILSLLFCAVFFGTFLPLYFEKPYFLSQTKMVKFVAEERKDPVRQLYDYKLKKLDFQDKRNDWFHEVSKGDVTNFLPNGLIHLSYSSSGLINVPNIFLEKVPNGLGDLPAGQKKAVFIRFMLPLILRANQQIWDHRQEIMEEKSLSDKTAIKNIAKLYNIERNIYKNDEIESWANEHVLPIPTSLALAQAAIESGWGTSRFSIQGNALFGQWSWSPQSGIKPLYASNNQAVVRSFNNLQSSVNAYMKNLNTHPAYKEFRALRNSYISKGKWPDGMELAISMHPYAETGDHYVETIRNIILQNNLQRFDYSKLLTR